MFLAGCGTQNQSTNQATATDNQQNDQTASSSPTRERQRQTASGTPEMTPPTDQATMASGTLPQMPADGSGSQPPQKRGTSTPGNPGQMNLPDGQQPFFGEISAISGDAFTIKERNDSTRTIKLTNETKFESGAKSDLTVGTNIAGSGPTETDGTISALTIRIDPTMPTGGPGGGGTPPDGGQAPMNQ